MDLKPSSSPKAGRPRVETPKVKKSVSLAPELYQYLLKIGKGKLSGGVEAAAVFHQSSSKLSSKLNQPTATEPKGAS
jgi:hypothetical protein